MTKDTTFKLSNQVNFKGDGHIFWNFTSNHFTNFLECQAFDISLLSHIFSQKIIVFLDKSTAKLTFVLICRLVIVTLGSRKSPKMAFFGQSQKIKLLWSFYFSRLLRQAIYSKNCVRIRSFYILMWGLTARLGLANIKLPVLLTKSLISNFEPKLWK